MTENPSFVKMYWPDIREKIAQLDATFTKIVDDLGVDKSFPIYLASYPYGALIADTQSPFIPCDNGTVKRLTAPEVDKSITEDLGYGKDGLPMGMVLNKQLEYFIDLKGLGVTIPWLIYEPGSFFPLSSIFNQKNKRNYASNSVLMTTAGARSTFMLPNIGCSTNHINLKRDFNVKTTTPKTLYDHWYVFKEIVNSPILASDWRCEVIYFAEKWLKKLYTDTSWLALKSYLQELAWSRFEYDRNRVYYDIAFSVIQQKRNLKPNPYLADTARHLFSIALGCVPGYAPALGEEAIPVSILQKVFVESYNLKKYIPTIMQPVNYNFESNPPVYYSLQHPSTHMFSPKSRKISSTLSEMRELDHITNIFSEELANDNAICADTILNQVSKAIKFNYFHNEKDRLNVIKPSCEIVKLDDRFNYVPSGYSTNESTFSADARFVRGCVSISKIN